MPASNDAGWTTSANAYSSNNTYATAAPAKNNTKTVNLGTFGFDAAIPANATITGVTVTVEWKVSTTASIATLGASATVNGTPVGTELVNAAEPTADTSQSFAIPGLTRAQLLNGALGVRVRATRGNSNTAVTASLDAVSVKVDYTAADVTAISVNAAGATTARGTDSFAYDQANRLRTATVAGTTETSTYDGDGVRFSRQVGAGPVIRAVTDPTAGLPVTIDDGSRKYVWGASGLAYAVSGTSIEVQHTDRLGSVRAVTNGTGAVIATFRTDEFGIPTSSTGSAGSPFRYTGEPLDASGLTYLRARHYDATIGRFMTRDPFAGFASTPLSLNRYSYVANNPATWSDPSGRSPSSSVLSGGYSAGFCANLQAGAGGFLTINACLAKDDTGRRAVLLTRSTELGLMLGIGASYSAGYFGANGRIGDLLGPFDLRGGSITVPPAYAGGIDVSTGGTVTMVEIALGLSIGLPAEFHAGTTDTALVIEDPAFLDAHGFAPVWTSLDLILAIQSWF